MINLFERPGPIRPPISRADDARRLQDPADVAAARRYLGTDGRGNYLFATAPGADADWLSEVEAYGSAEELGAQRDRELWGDNPFELD